MKKRREKVHITPAPDIAGANISECARADSVPAAPLTLGERIRRIPAIARASELAARLSGERERLMTLLLPMLYTLIFSEIPFEMGTYPFGISAVCAAASGAPLILAVVGATASSFFVRGGVFIAAAAVLGAAAIFLAEKLFGERARHSLTFRCAVSLVMNIAAVLAMSAKGGISFFELCSVVLMFAAAPPLTCALSSVFTEDGRRTPLVEAGICALLFTAAYSLRGAGTLGESAAEVLSLGVTLVASYSFGIHRGVMVGVAFGLAAAPELTLIYPCAAIISGVLSGLSAAAAVGTAAVAALALGVLEDGAPAIGRLFPEFMFTAAVTAPILHYKLIPLSAPLSGNTGRGAPEISVAKDRAESSGRKIYAISESLGALAGVMSSMSRAFSRPSLYELRQMCDEAFDESCAACASRDICWDREYRETAGSLTKIATALRRDGHIGITALPDGVRGRCRSGEAIVGRINLGCSMRTRAAAASDNAAVTAEDFTAMSKILADMTERTDEEFERDRDASALLEKALAGIGIGAAEVSVYGTRRRRVFVRGLGLEAGAGSEEVRRAAERILECGLSSPEYTIDGRSVTMKMHTRERYSAVAGRHSVAKAGEYCGDSAASFTGDGGYFYTLIADGMGSGKDAALTSGLCAVFLERMLGAGCSLTAVLEMLNEFLARRSMECFTTVDLMELDLVTGEARFVKSGAAPSFVLRKDKLFRLASETYPVGIVRSFDGEVIRFSAMAGDIVIMLSDGVVPDGEECPWLYDLLCGSDPLFAGTISPAEAARRISDTAARITGSRDDISVAVVKIGDA